MVSSINTTISTAAAFSTSANTAAAPVTTTAAASATTTAASAVFQLNQKNAASTTTASAATSTAAVQQPTVCKPVVYNKYADLPNTPEFESLRKLVEHLSNKVFMYPLFAFHEVGGNFFDRQIEITTCGKFNVVNWIQDIVHFDVTQRNDGQFDVCPSYVNGKHGNPNGPFTYSSDSEFLIFVHVEIKKDDPMDRRGDRILYGFDTTHGKTDIDTVVASSTYFGGDSTVKVPPRKL